MGYGNYIASKGDGGYNFLHYVPPLTEATTSTLTDDGLLSAQNPSIDSIEFAYTFNDGAIEMLPQESVTDLGGPSVLEHCVINAVTRELTCDPQNTGKKKFFSCQADSYSYDFFLLGDQSQYPNRSCMDTPPFAIPKGPVVI